MYHLYHTDALVLGGNPSGEGSKTIVLFTKEFGLLSATARSVREERSKLRYGLQDFSYSHISLVRGQERWRLTGAELIRTMFDERRESGEVALVMGRICKLLRRLLVGEEKNEPLFVAVAEGLHFIREQKDKALLEGAEIILVLRILFLLGYLAPRNEFDPFLSHAGMWDENVVSQALLFRALAVSEINQSLKASQL